MQGRIRLAALLLAVPIGAAAAPSYTYLQGERIADGKTELDGTADVRLDGYAAEASSALGERGFFRIDYSGIELDFFETDVDRWGLARSSARTTMSTSTGCSRMSAWRSIPRTATATASPAACG